MEEIDEDEEEGESAEEEDDDNEDEDDGVDEGTAGEKALPPVSDKATDE